MEKLTPYRGPVLIKDKWHVWVKKQGFVEAKPVLAKPILEFQPGERILWNSGMQSEVISIEPTGTNLVTLLQREDDGKLYPHTFRKHTLLAMVPQQGEHR